VSEPETNAQGEPLETPAGEEPIAAQPPAAAVVPAPVPVHEETTDDPLFEVLWAKVISSWDDDKTHGAALEYSLQAERLPDLAGRYRALVGHPEKGERAKKRLDAIVIAATQMMMSMKTPTNVKVPLPITLSVAGLFLAAVLFVAYAMAHGR
jgi:hypothetical protein